MKRYLADLHVHTTCSDGWVKPEKIPGYAQKKGLDIVAVTDHDSIEGGIRAKKASEKGGAFVIPGIEVSLQNAHVLGFFIENKIRSNLLKEVIEEIRDQGGIAVWAHPVHYPALAKFRRRQPVVPQKDELNQFDAIEVFNGRNSKKGNLKISELCNDGRKIPLIAGSDAHFSFEIGAAKTIVKSEGLNDESLKDAFRSGRVASASDVKGFRLGYYITGILNKIAGRRH
jgi:predicted metal-dependent phosphoesterase TrpH